MGSDEMHEVAPMDEMLRVAAMVFRQFLTELGCHSGKIELTDDFYKIVVNKGNNAHFTDGKV